MNSVAELKAMALTKPDQLNYATLGEGSYPDLFLRWMNNQWGTKIVGVPYKGGGPAAQALAGNQVQLTRFGIGNFLGLVKAGKVKAIAVSAANARRCCRTCRRSPRRALAVSPAKAGGGWRRRKARRRRSSTRSMPTSSKCSATRNSWRFWTSRRWCRRRPRRPAFAASSKEDRKAAEALVKIANTKREEYKPH